VLFRRRVLGVVVVVVEEGLGEHAKKKLFSHKKKICFSMTTRVRYRLAYPEKCTFSYLFMIFRDHIGGGEKSIHRSKRVATRK
jgi:hypothetical protein